MAYTRRGVLAGGAALAFAGMARAEERMVSGPVQYIAALAGKDDTSGTGAEHWGLWELDPGPRGVWMRDYPAMVGNNNVAPDGWVFDPAGWWVEEYGRIMEPPRFPLPADRYVVTGGRDVTSVLTIDPPDASGARHWSLADGATVYDVTHLRCRAALYTPRDGQTCSPRALSPDAFPVRPGDVMPAASGCAKQDYQVLIVIGRLVDS